MAKALDLGDAYSVGSILDEGWQIKQELDDSITNSEINEIYTQAKHYGAVGGKIVGAGGGGFLLLCIPQINAESFDRKFNYLRELKFSVEYGGVNIVYNDMLGN
jgi:D-glycero-alpha-D-manno-heptose-7-phosphate kinase